MIASSPRWHRHAHRLVVLIAIVVLVSSFTVHSKARADNTGAIVGGVGIIGLGIASAFLNQPVAASGLLHFWGTPISAIPCGIPPANPCSTLTSPFWEVGLLGPVPMVGMIPAMSMSGPFVPNPAGMVVGWAVPGAPPLATQFYGY